MKGDGGPSVQTKAWAFITYPWRDLALLSASRATDTFSRRKDPPRNGSKLTALEPEGESHSGPSPQGR